MKKDTNPPGEGPSATEGLTPFPPAGPGETQDDASTSGAVRYGFRIGDTGFILAARERAEVIDPLAPCPIPNTPAWFRGMINVRGNLVPVFDLLRLFDGGGEYASYKLITIGQHSKTVALPIDELPETVQLTELAGETSALPAILHTHIRDAYFYKDRIWIDMDFDGFFNGLGSRLLI